MGYCIDVPTQFFVSDLKCLSLRSLQSVALIIKMAGRYGVLVQIINAILLKLPMNIDIYYAKLISKLFLNQFEAHAKCKNCLKRRRQ